MNTDADISLGSVLEQLDAALLRRTYLEQDEFVVIERVMPPALLEQWQAAIEPIRPHLHRSFIPRHKKGGSAAYDTVRRLGPAITRVYHDPWFQELLCRLTGTQLQECPANDPHRCALYAYTEEGDHIGWHYDTSYYRDRRWTALIGLQDQSRSRLVCELHTRNPGRAVERLELQIKPGMLVLFNGDKVRHRVTPLGPGESRFVVSMQYVTEAAMNPFLRFVSNMKDAIAYFGFLGVFRARDGRPGMDGGKAPESRDEWRNQGDKRTPRDGPDQNS